MSDPAAGTVESEIGPEAAKGLRALRALLEALHPDQAEGTNPATRTPAGKASTGTPPPAGAT